MNLISQTEVVIFDQPLSPRNANYRMDVTLDPDSKIVSGDMTLSWTNISSKSTNELQFHLYLNAFASKKSTHVMESGSGLLASYGPNDYGYSMIKHIKVDQVDLTDRLEFIQPDDANEHDSTVVKLALDRDINPGDSLTIDIEFISKLPKLVRRTGFIDQANTSQNFFLVAQWFPKIGVLETEGWNCHQFHANTEFFSDYGVYDVKITLPRKFVVGASGLEVERKDQGDLVTHYYHAEDIHDFMWTAYPEFNVHNTQHKDIAIRMLYNDEQSQQHVEEQVQSLKYGIDFYTDHFGPYPYPNITFLNAPAGAGAANGMEYPTIFTGGYVGMLPKGVSFRFEMVTIHEYGHQVFYGIIGTNEFQWSWMDEGFNQFGEMGTEDEYYGGAVNLPDLVITAADFNRFPYIMQPNNENLMRTSFLQRGSNYSINSYMRPAILLKTMEQYLGKELFYKGMRNYYQQWKFKHPRPDDFFSAFNMGADVDMNWFFDQFFRQNKVIDYTVKSISSRPVSRDTLQRGKNIQESGDISFDGSKPIFLNQIEIENLGDGWHPIDLQIQLSDNTIYDGLLFDVRQNKNSVRFYSNEEIVRAELDPNRKLYMDLSFTNNGISREVSNASNKFVNRWMFWLQNMLQLISGF